MNVKHVFGRNGNKTHASALSSNELPPPFSFSPTEKDAVYRAPPPSTEKDVECKESTEKILSIEPPPLRLKMSLPRQKAS